MEEVGHMAMDERMLRFAPRPASHTRSPKPLSRPHQGHQTCSRRLTIRTGPVPRYPVLRQRSRLPDLSCMTPIQKSHLECGGARQRRRGSNRWSGSNPHRERNIFSRQKTTCAGRLAALSQQHSRIPLHRRSATPTMLQWAPLLQRQRFCHGSCNSPQMPSVRLGARDREVASWVREILLRGVAVSKRLRYRSSDGSGPPRTLQDTGGSRSEW